jgi:hypothetical protein
MHALAKQDSPLMLRIKTEVENFFQKRFAPFFIIANKLKVSDDEGTVIRAAVELPGINADFEVLLAIVFQNLQQPKNSQRKDAVSSKNYREILNQESARSYLTESLTQSLTNKVNARTKEINTDA